MERYRSLRERSSCTRAGDLDAVMDSHVPRAIELMPDGTVEGEVRSTTDSPASWPHGR